MNQLISGKWRNKVVANKSLFTVILGSIIFHTYQHVHGGIDPLVCPQHSLLQIQMSTKV